MNTEYDRIVNTPFCFMFVYFMMVHILKLYTVVVNRVKFF